MCSNWSKSVWCKSLILFVVASSWAEAVYVLFVTTAPYCACWCILPAEISCTALLGTGFEYSLHCNTTLTPFFSAMTSTPWSRHKGVSDTCQPHLRSVSAQKASNPAGVMFSGIVKSAGFCVIASSTRCKILCEIIALRLSTIDCWLRLTAERTW